MIMPTAEKQKTFQSSLRKIFLIFLFSFCSYCYSYAQSEKDISRKLKKVDLVFNSAKQNNFLFLDKDYDYKTNLLKFQFYYDLNLHEKWDFNLVVQPQLQFIQHQLLNEQFMTPDKPNYLFYREKFTQNKSISLFAFELGFQLRTNLFNSLF